MWFKEASSCATPLQLSRPSNGFCQSLSRLHLGLRKVTCVLLAGRLNAFTCIVAVPSVTLSSIDLPPLLFLLVDLTDPPIEAHSTVYHQGRNQKQSPKSSAYVPVLVLSSQDPEYLIPPTTSSNSTTSSSPPSPAQSAVSSVCSLTATFSMPQLKSSCDSATSPAVSVLLCWASTCVAYLHFHASVKADGIPFRSPCSPSRYGSKSPFVLSLRFLRATMHSFHGKFW